MRGFFKESNAVTVCVILSATVLISFCLLTSGLPLQKEVSTTTEPSAVHILIDPGHGGADGGATASDGTAEKDYNLAISQTLGDFLRFCGYAVTLTRNEDVSIHDTSVTGLRQQKVSDMHNRLSLYNAADLVISVHQNKFAQRSCHGTQFFYSPNNAASLPLGTTLRATLYDLLQPDNTRELKAGTSDIFLLYETTAPAVLVECGFLSHTEERALLQTDEYRQQLAYALTCGILQYEAG